jgi:aldehyde dehydrogenase (NAD+)
VPEGAPEDARRAATAAAAAFERWSTITGVARADHLYRWSAAIGDRQEELAQAVAREVGKPIGEARGEVARCVAILRYYAGEAVREVG